MDGLSFCILLKVQGLTLKKVYIYLTAMIWLAAGGINVYTLVVFYHGDKGKQSSNTMKAATIKSNHPFNEWDNFILCNLYCRRSIMMSL